MPALLDDRPAADTHTRFPAGPEQGVIKEARRRQRRRRVRVAIGVLLGFAAIAGAASAITSSGSATRIRRASRGTVRRATTTAGFDIRLSPALDGGQYGWCVGVEEHAGTIAGGGCAAIPVLASPLVMELSSSSVTSREETTILLTDPRVAAVLVNGRRRIPTVALAGLPYGLRAARILASTPIVNSANGRRAIRAHQPAIRIVLLDARGHPISDGLESPHVAASQPSSGTGACDLSASGVLGLTKQWTHLAPAIRPFPGMIVGRAFFSCIDAHHA
jgi:hypothetical protein